MAQTSSDHFDSHLDVVPGGLGVSANFVVGFGDESLGSGAVHAINMCLQVDRQTISHRIADVQRYFRSHIQRDIGRKCVVECETDLVPRVEEPATAS